MLNWRAERQKGRNRNTEPCEKINDDDDDDMNVVVDVIANRERESQTAKRTPAKQCCDVKSERLIADMYLHYTHFNNN